MGVEYRLGSSIIKTASSKKEVSQAPVCGSWDRSCPQNRCQDPYRLVHQMSSFKLFFYKQRFKMDGISTVPTVFPPERFLFKLDFQAGYHAFLVRPWMRRFLLASLRRVVLRVEYHPVRFSVARLLDAPNGEVQ